MSLLNIINFEDKTKWNNIVKSFPDYDIYYLHEYVAPFKIISNSELFLIHFKNNDSEICYVVEKNDIADFGPLSNALEKNKVFDISTPYGYGGPLVKNIDEKNTFIQKEFFDNLSKWAQKENIVSQFIRFHPLLQNHKYVHQICDIKNLKNTVTIELKSEEEIWLNMSSTCRNRIRKAKNNGIEIKVDNSIESQMRFIQLYKETMDKNNATDFYYFNQEFFKEIFKYLGSGFNIFNSILNNRIISSAIILDCNKSLHYHLGCTDIDYIKLAPNNLLFYEIALWGARNGYTNYHLGGGVGIEDSLLTFKKTFNKNGLIDFYIGRSIFDIIKYRDLMNLRKQLDESFNLDTNYMIGYRA